MSLPADQKTDALHLIIASDDPTLQEEARFAFPSDAAVTLVTDAREASERMREQAPSAVVVDLQTGSAGGFALLRDMRATERLKEVPVLVLLERHHDVWLAQQVGANAIRSKPLSVSDLVDEVLALTSG